MKRWLERVVPLLTVLGALFVLGYPIAFLMGYPLAKTNLEDHNRWSQRVVEAQPPLGLSNPTHLRFAEAAPATGVLIEGDALVAEPYAWEDGAVVMDTSAVARNVQLTTLEGPTDGHNQVFRTEQPASDQPLYLNGRLLTSSHERPPEKPDGSRMAFSFTDSSGVFVLRGRLLRPGQDYALEDNSLVLAQPAPLWLSLTTEPDWARPLRITGDYAWADAHTIVFSAPPPVGSTLQLASRVVRWAEVLGGPADGLNRTFSLVTPNLSVSDTERQIYVDGQLLRTQGRRATERPDNQRTAFTFPETQGVITRNGVALEPARDYTQDGATVSFVKPPSRRDQLLQFDYVVVDAATSVLRLAAAPAPGSVVWAKRYTIYDHPRCGTNVFECFLSLPQHPVPLPHWLVTKAPAFFAKHPWDSDSNVVREVVYTARGTLVALLAGGAVGLLLAAAFVLIRPLERALLPWVIASQTVPIIALVPMLVLILANFGITIQTSILPTAIIGGYLSFFPITVGAAKGLRSVDPLALDLMRSYAANRWQVFFKVRLYAALPFIFASFKVGAAASLVGALISETETSNAKGLGYAILGQVQAGNVADLWLLFIISSLMGIAFVAGVGWVERWLAPWVRKA